MNKYDPFAPPPFKRELSEYEALQKRAIYEKMSPRRRKFVDRLGYEQWDPFAAPKEPLDIRREGSGRTAHELARDFLKWRAGQREVPGEAPGGASERNASGSDADAADSDYVRGVLECALAIINRDEKYRGIYEFCLWYGEQARDAGD